MPVCQGAERSWSGSPLKTPVQIHGTNGLGNVDLPDSDVGPSTTRAANFIVQQCDLYPSQVSILFLGPLTNLAEALRLDPQLPNKWVSTFQKV